MSFPTLPLFQGIGVAMQATITAYNSSTTDFSFTTAGTSYNANWNVDVLANAINTIGHTVGSNGRLNLTAAKARNLGLTGWQSVGSNYGGTDYQTYTAYNATVRSISGNNIGLTIGTKTVTVDWTNPAHVWTGSETTLRPTAVGNVGVVRIGDAFGRSTSLGGPDKWPISLLRAAVAEVRVRRVGAIGEVVVLDRAGAPVVDSRGQAVTWRLPEGDPAVDGFDASDFSPQTVRMQHVLKAKLGMP